MGDFGIAGLWLLLALALISAVVVGAAGMWLAHRTLPEQVSEGYNGRPRDLIGHAAVNAPIG
jgi:hypothetical protein